MAKGWFALPCYWNVCFFASAAFECFQSSHLPAVNMLNPSAFSSRFVVWRSTNVGGFENKQLMHLLLGLSLNIYCTSTYVTR